MKTIETKAPVRLIVILFIAAYGVYYNSLNAPFIFDDAHMIVKNTFITHPKHFPWFFKGFVTSAPIPRGMCRPLLMLSFAFNYWISNLSPRSYHVVNIFIHIVNALVLFRILLFFTKKEHFSLISILTFLFVIHPLNTETVTYLSCRSDLLVSFFILAGFYASLKEKPWATALAYLLALLTKETSLCLPMLIVVYDIFFRKYSFNLKRISRDILIKYLLILSLTLFYLFYKSALFTQTPMRVLRSFYDNFLIQSYVCTLYLNLFFIPFPLTILHPTPRPLSLFTPAIFFSCLTLLVLMIIVLGLRKSRPLLAFGITWFLICLIPKFYIRLHYVSFEHHSYLPSFGIYLALLSLLSSFWLTKQKLSILGLLILFTFSMLTVKRTAEFNNPLVLWQKAVTLNPTSGTLHNQLGILLWKQGKLQEAQEEFLTTIKINERKETVLNAKLNLAQIYISRKSYQEANTLLTENIDTQKIVPIGLHKIKGTILKHLGKETEALQEWFKELAINPASTGTYLELGKYFFEKNSLTDAQRFFAQAVKTDPHHFGGYFGLARIKEKQNNLKEAIRLYEKSLSCNSQDYLTHYLLGSLYAQIGDARALTMLTRAIILNPEFAPAHNDLAVLYASLSPPRWFDAYRHLLKARQLGFRIHPEFYTLVLKNVRHENH